MALTLLSLCNWKNALNGWQIIFINRRTGRDGRRGGYLPDRLSSRVHHEKFEPVSKVLNSFLTNSLLVLSAKSISDVKPTAQRMPPTSKIIRNLTSSTVLLPGSVLMQQQSEGNQGKCHWNLSNFKAKGVEWFHFRKSASFLWHIHGKVFPLSALKVT